MDNTFVLQHLGCIFMPLLKNVHIMNDGKNLISKISNSQRLLLIILTKNERFEENCVLQ